MAEDSILISYHPRWDMPLIMAHHLIILRYFLKYEWSRLNEWSLLKGRSNVSFDWMFIAVFDQKLRVLKSNPFTLKHFLPNSTSIYDYFLQDTPLIIHSTTIYSLVIWVKSIFHWIFENKFWLFLDL